MNEDFKKIAKGLGVVLPACLLSIGTANATVPMPTMNNDVSPVCVKLNKGNDVITHLMANVTNYSSNNLSPEHTDYHTDSGGNHTDSHSNYPHANDHNNTAATTKYQRVKNDDGTYSSVPYCAPHSDSHSNRNAYNNHTNSGNARHSDRHNNIDSKYNCN